MDSLRKKKKILDKSEKNSKIKVWGASSAPLSFKGDELIEKKS